MIINKMNKNKTLIIAISFVVVLLSGFVFGHFVFKSDSSPQPVDSEQRQHVSNNISDSRHNAITETVENVSSAIVGINVTEIREYKDPFGDYFGNDPFFRQFFGDRSFKQEVHGLGSGFIISEDGYLVTNYHVVGNASKVVVTLTSGENYDAEVIGKDPVSDIALLKIDKGGLPYVKLGNSDDVMIGEWAIALGNPFGLFEVNQKPTVTVGVISATKMRLSADQNRFYRNMIQTDAAINSGNSGGALFNSVGEVIGMNTLIYTGNAYNTGNIGLGFAIPINKVKKIMDILRKDKKIDRNYNIGIRLQTVDQGIAQYFKLKKPQGAIVVSMERGTPIEDAGIKTEDIIIAVNGEAVNSDIDFWGIITDQNIGDKITLKIIRGGEEIEKSFELKTK
ncbi:MAG: PDZ domain-containing protein [Ignavibacteriae bacterium]|nr:MAG: PDZ domain-containing protein [Ignavibacteriota bacterium]